LTDEKTGFPWVAPSGLDFLPLWLEFLESKWQKAVNRDLWRQTLAFMVKAKEDESLGFWSEESSWPSVIDDFVQWVKVEKRGEAMEE
jgi:DCN1-like protein 1/2